jgi:hypothetical protein
MIEFFLLFPNFLSARSHEANEKLLKDTLSLMTVLALSKPWLKGLQTSMPRYTYVSLALYVLFSDIINDLSYRALPPNENLKRGWATLQKKQTKEDLSRLIELRCEDFRNQ